MHINTLGNYFDLNCSRLILISEENIFRGREYPLENLRYLWTCPFLGQGLVNPFQSGCVKILFQILSFCRETFRMMRSIFFFVTSTLSCHNSSLASSQAEVDFEKVTSQKRNHWVISLLWHHEFNCFANTERTQFPILIPKGNGKLPMPASLELHF